MPFSALFWTKQVDNILVKMWIISIALFTVYGVISGSPDICDKDAPDICFPPNVEPLEMPDSIEALDKICPDVTTRLGCLVDYKLQCGTEVPGTIDDNLDQIYELVSDACDKDSELHQELSIRLPCMERVVTNHRNTCHPIVEEVIEAVRSRIELSLDSDSDDESPEEWRKYYCLYEALDVACLVADASVTCGDATKELMERILDRVGYLDSVCHADIHEEVKEMVSVMQVEIVEGLAVKNVVSKT